VIMPNHVHALVQLQSGFALSDILHSWKSFTAKEINRINGTKGTLWQDEHYDRIVRDFAELQRYRDYIARNPEDAKLNVGQFLVQHVEVLQPLNHRAGETPAGPTGEMPVLQTDLRRAKKLGFSDRQLAV